MINPASLKSLRRLDYIQGMRRELEANEVQESEKRSVVIRTSEQGQGFKDTAINLSFMTFTGFRTDMVKQFDMEINQANVKITSGKANCIYPVKNICT